MNKIPPKYAGKYVALVNEHIVAEGRSQLKVYKKAKKDNPQKMITLEYIPTKKETLTFL